jgi:hypothetical protein
VRTLKGEEFSWNKKTSISLACFNLLIPKLRKIT